MFSIRLRCMSVLVYVCVVVAMFSPSCPAQTSLPAFPGAEGMGAFTTGGRGGDVYHVTSLEDSGPGTLREGIAKAKGPRTIVFDVGGLIALEKSLHVNRPDITIAGQTAPGQGICIIHNGLLVNNNVILRHIRVRPGDARKGDVNERGFSGDSLSLWGSRIIVDHCSATWSIDENLSSAAENFHEVTIQDCVIAEGLYHTGLWHGTYQNVPGHSNGSLIKPVRGDGSLSIIRCLYASNASRNPAVGSYSKNQTVHIDFRNNVIYNCRGNGYSSGESKSLNMNYVNNCILAGPATGQGARKLLFDARKGSNMLIYQGGNKIDRDCDGNWNVVHIGWEGFRGECTQRQEPFPAGNVTTLSAEAAYNRVLADVGPFPWNRDNVDARIINDMIHGTGQIIDSQEGVGGYPPLPTVGRQADFDTDADGMSDTWELSHGCNPKSADNNEDRDGDGYTNLEEYLSWIPADQAAATKSAATTAGAEVGK